MSEPRASFFGDSQVDPVRPSDVEEEAYISPYFYNPERNTNKSWYEEDEVNLSRFEADIFEVSKHPYDKLTKEDLRSAREVYNKTYEALKQKGWFNASKARRDGFYPRPRGSGDYWYNVEKDSLMRRAGNFSPRYPRILLYYDTDGSKSTNISQKILAGVMIEKETGSKARGEQFAGPLSRWHYHKLSQSGSAASLRGFIDRFDQFNSSQDLFEYHAWNRSIDAYIRENTRGPEMIHIWFVKHPEGPFGTRMLLPDRTVKPPSKMNRSEFYSYAKASFKKRRQEMTYG